MTATLTECPAGHTAYPSRLVADNAVALHRIARPYCGGYHAWVCQNGDHWHIGHTTGQVGRECKRNPTHRATFKRLELANRIGRWR